MKGFVVESRSLMPSAVPMTSPVVRAELDVLCACRCVACFMRIGHCRQVLDGCHHGQ